MGRLLCPEESQKTCRESLVVKLRSRVQGFVSVSEYQHVVPLRTFIPLAVRVVVSCPCAHYLPKTFVSLVFFTVRRKGVKTVGN